MAGSMSCKRVDERPDPECWAIDELMTLAEAVQLHWPKGPANRICDGQLSVCVIAGIPSQTSGQE
jgi:hypothetical protein